MSLEYHTWLASTLHFYCNALWLEDCQWLFELREWFNCDFFELHLMKALNERLYSLLSYLLPHLKFGVFLLLLTGFFLNSWAHNYSKHWAGLNFYDFIINSFFNVNGRLTMYVTTYFNSGCAFNRRQVSPRPLWFTMCPKDDVPSGGSQYTDLQQTPYVL